MQKVEKFYIKYENYINGNSVKANEFEFDDWIANTDQEGNIKGAMLNQILTFDSETSNGYVRPITTLDNEGLKTTWTVEKYNDEAVKKDSDYYKGCYKVGLLYSGQLCVEDENEPYYTYVRDIDGIVRMFEELDSEIFAAYKVWLMTHECKNPKAPEVRVYVHNLGFDFEYLRNVFSFEDVFARSTNHPMYAVARSLKDGRPLNCDFKFVDTYSLTQKSLAQWSKDSDLQVKKKSEPEEFYKEMRTPYDKLTEDELDYNKQDVLAVYYGMCDYRNQFGNLKKIPLTQTGIVRDKLNKYVYARESSWCMLQADITKRYTWDVFQHLVKCYTGGWVHSNAKHADKILTYVRAFDFASSYPAVMCLHKFPVGYPQNIMTVENEVERNQQINFLLNQDIESLDLEYMFTMSVRLKNVRCKLDNTYISISKIDELVFKDDSIFNIDNGRLIKCESGIFHFTALDWAIVKQAYEFEIVEFINFYAYKAEFLPKALVEIILEYYAYKTTMKGIEEFKERYAESKQFINSIYGVAVTKIVDAIIEYDVEGWHKYGIDDEYLQTKGSTPAEYFEDLVSDTKANKTSLSYQIGVFVSAWARYNLFKCVIKLDKNVVYCDTDSIKGTFGDEDMKVIEDYNKEVEFLQEYVSNMYNIPLEQFRPTAPNGEKESIGVFDEEEFCVKFKTLGAKRYIREFVKNGESVVSATIAGLPSKGRKEAFPTVNDFNDGTDVPVHMAHKNTASYIDPEKFPEDLELEWTGRDGDVYYSNVMHGVVITPTKFSLNMSQDFKDLTVHLSKGNILSEILI